jgi:hypothetical protein
MWTTPGSRPFEDAVGISKIRAGYVGKSENTVRTRSTGRVARSPERKPGTKRQSGDSRRTRVETPVTGTAD